MRSMRPPSRSPIPRAACKMCRGINALLNSVVRSRARRSVDFYTLLSLFALCCPIPFHQVSDNKVLKRPQRDGRCRGLQDGPAECRILRPVRKSELALPLNIVSKDCAPIVISRGALEAGTVLAWMAHSTGIRRPLSRLRSLPRAPGVPHDVRPIGSM